MPFLEEKRSHKMPNKKYYSWEDKVRRIPSRIPRLLRNIFIFRVNSNGAIKNMRYDSTNFEINLLHEIQEKSPEMHITSRKTIIGRQGTLQTHNITLPGKYSSIQKETHI
jgi:hypothetical protein